MRLCTQYRKEDWVKQLGGGVQAEAIVDRYAYTAYWIDSIKARTQE